MRIDTLSTFPKMYDSVMGESMMKRAQEKGILSFYSHDLRDWTHDRHKTTDDYPYGGGCGLLMLCEPVFEAVEEILGMEKESLPTSSVHDSQAENDTKIIFLAPHGKPFDDSMAKRLSKSERLLFICGHYEGMDERVYSIADEIISIGDYVLTSGELASMVVIDAVVRQLPGVLGADAGPIEESFSDGLLECPQYTRPQSFRGMDVPDVLLSGHHANIKKHNRKESLRRTYTIRPDLIEKAIQNGQLDDADLMFLDSLSEASQNG